MRLSRQYSRLPRWAQGLVGIVFFLVLLEVVPLSGLVSTQNLPPLSSVLAALAEELPERAFWVSVGQTVQAWAIGLAIALALGIALGFLLGTFPVLQEFTATTIEFLRPIPSVALIPIVVLLYGTSIGSTLVLVVYASVWQILVQVLYGIRDVDPVAAETARSYRFRRASRISNVVWPSALPYVMTGVRLAASVALVLTLTAQLVIGSPGLGSAIANAQSSGAIAKMYALILVAGLFGVLVNVAARLVERRVLSWHTSIRSEVPR
jgi:ABC-type nitrate/sulfonate/bicarbonate transport system permease component